MDLTISSWIAAECMSQKNEPIDPYSQNSIDSSLQVWDLSGLEMKVCLESHQRVLLSTVEIVQIPPEHIGLISLRSTWARLGLMSPTTIADPGFNGSLTMEIFNSSRNAIYIRKGDKLWSLNLVYAPGTPLYTGRYQNQSLSNGLPKALPIPNSQI